MLTKALSEPCFLKEYCGNPKCECHTEFISYKQQETSNSSPLKVLFNRLKRVYVSQINVWLYFPYNS